VGGSGGDTGSGGTHAAADGSYQATQLAVGEDHSCAVLTTGQVACWGSNTFGQLGDGSDRVLRRPYAAVIEGLTNVVSISASEYLTCALDAEHHVYCWGLAGVQSDLQPRSWDAPTRVEPLDDATAIATGAAHACALVSGGRVVCWGSNEHGKLGDGMTAPDATSFQDAPVTVKELDGVTALAAGRAHTCARSGSTVRCWGNNANGELSTGIASQSAVPISVGEVPGATTLSAALATFITLQSGDVSCWGLGTGGLLIDPEADFTKPRALGLDHVELTAVGPSAVCTLRSLAADNGIVACRALSDTKLNWAPATRWESLVLPAGSRVVNIAVGDHHACAALSGGGVQCWGSNGAGELGDTTFTSSRTARHVAGF
jgi:alpha-tubulin suppressor-like RCC1 family protein